MTQTPSVSAHPVSKLNGPAAFAALVLATTFAVSFVASVIFVFVTGQVGSPI